MWPYPKIVAHRGAGSLAPENTLAAMRYARKQGFRGVEFDVMLAADGEPVLMHDPQLGRTVGGTGNVNQHTAAQLQKMDAGTWFGPHFAGEPVPGFDEIANFCRASDIWMNVEIKPAPGFEVATGDVVARHAARIFAAELQTVPTAQSAARLPLLSSFSVEALLAAQAAAPTMPRALLVDALPADWQARCAEVGAGALHLNHRSLTAGAAHAVRQAGLGLFCYTVNDPARARMLLSWGVDGFCTDRIDLIGPDFASKR